MNATPILGNEVAAEVLQCIGAFRVLKEALIVSYNMQDYDFWDQGRLSWLLRRQIANGAKVTLLTTPPPGKSTKQAFKDKLTLLEDLSTSGIDIYLNERLHAKAYLFFDQEEMKTTIVGSANLTKGGFGIRSAPLDCLLELALITYDPEVHKKTANVIYNKIIGDIQSMDFYTWRILNRERIGLAKGGPKDE